MKVTLTRVTTDPVDAIEEAACNCYDSKPTDGKIMKSCYRSGHHSVLEFANFTFHIEGVSRALLAQLTRHRHAGFAVRSQRYCNEDGFEYVIPPSIRNDLAACTKFKETVDTIAEAYSALQEYNISNEDARYILPNACCTTLEFTCNGRELIHICNERLCTRAQWEIRSLVTLMVKSVAEYNEQCAAFSLFLVPKCEVLGLCTEHNCCGRNPKHIDVMNDYNRFKQVKTLAKRFKDGYITAEKLASEFYDNFCTDI